MLIDVTCKQCGKSVKRNEYDPGKYCSNDCQRQYQFENVTLRQFEEGLLSNRRTLHRVLCHEHGHNCAECGVGETYNDKPLTLQVDHIDGNASNDMPSNLQLLCPNCHSQTSTFTARNKGHGRQAVGVKR